MSLHGIGEGNAKIPHPPREENDENLPPLPEERGCKTRVHPLHEESEEKILAQRPLREDVLRKNILPHHPVEG